MLKILPVIAVVILTASCSTIPSPYCTGDGFKIGNFSQSTNSFIFTCPHGGAVRLLMLIPNTSAEPFAASGKLIVSDGRKELLQYNYSKDTLRPCNGWLKEELSESYQAFQFGRQTVLDSFVTPGNKYTVTVDTDDDLPDGAMLYLFRLPPLYMFLP